MYSVSGATKTALQDGRRKKNYRFVVQKLITARQTTLGTITPQNNTYTIQSAQAWKHIKFHFLATTPSFTIYVNTVMPNNSGSTAYTIAHGVGTEEYRDIGAYEAGSVVTVTYRSGSASFEIVSEENIADPYWGEDFTIDNDTLVSESVLIDERMCSGDVLKYGLCEGSSIEFQYFNHPNITGRKIQAFIDCYYDGVNSESIPLGYFEVEKCARQASTGIMKATAYNKLQSDYLNLKANDLILAAYQEGTHEQYISNVNVNYILAKVLQGYAIDDFQNLQPTFTANTSNFAIEGYNDEFETYYDCMLIKVLCSVNSSYVSSGKVSGYNRITITGLGALKNRINDWFNGWLPDSAYTSMVKLQAKYKKNNQTYTYNGYAYGYPNNINSTELITPLIESIVVDSNVYFSFYIPVRQASGQSDTPTAQDVQNALNAFNLLTLKVERQAQNSPLGSVVVNSNVANWQDVTLRQLQSAVFESGCLFGTLDRETDLFRGVSLSTSTPVLTVDKPMYSQLWADEGNIHSWRYLIITYKKLENGQEVDATIQRTVNSSGTDDYYCSDNWLFRNLTWTASEIDVYANTMAYYMRNITWFPFECWCAGLPYIETGDRIKIMTNNSNYNTYILQRQLKGIQNLQDTYINGTLDIF